MALIAAGESPGSAVIANALAYIKSTQQESGGLLSWGSTNADADSWTIMSIVAAGEDPTATYWQSSTGNSPMHELVTFQQGDGSFWWQADDPGFGGVAKTTASAIQALLGRPWPVWDPMAYDANGANGIEKAEAIQAILDYFDLRITKVQVIAVLLEYFS
jgi:hypothetical protein